MEIKEVLRAVLTIALKMSDGQVDELLTKTDGKEILDEILTKDSERVKDLGTNKFQDGYKKAKLEVLTEKDKELIEKYEIEDSSLKGEQLIEAILNKQQPDTTGGKGKKASELTEDEIKKLPYVLKLESQHQKTLQEKQSEFEQNLNNQKSEFEATQMFSGMKETAQTILTNENYVLPEDAKIASNQRGLFLDTLKGYKSQKVEDKTYVLGEDGNRIEDAHGHPVLMEDFVRAKADSYFVKAASNGGGNAGNDNGGGANGGNKGGAGTTSKYQPKNLEELSKITNDANIAIDDRIAASEYYEAQQEK